MKKSVAISLVSGVLISSGVTVESSSSFGKPNSPYYYSEINSLEYSDYDESNTNAVDDDDNERMSSHTDCEDLSDSASVVESSLVYDGGCFVSAQAMMCNGGDSTADAATMLMNSLLDFDSDLEEEEVDSDDEDDDEDDGHSSMLSNASLSRSRAVASGGGPSSGYPSNNGNEQRRQSPPTSSKTYYYEAELKNRKKSSDNSSSSIKNVFRRGWIQRN